MFESETIFAWLHSQKTATDEYFILNFFPTAYRCSLLYDTVLACGGFLRQRCKSLQVCQKAELALGGWDEVMPENKTKKTQWSHILILNILEFQKDYYKKGVKKVLWSECMRKKVYLHC